MDEIFFEIHYGLEHEGPDTNEITRQAFSLIPNIIEGANLSDIGCGPGMQTLYLANLGI